MHVRVPYARGDRGDANVDRAFRSLKVQGVEPVGADSTTRSFAAGAPVTFWYRHKARYAGRAAS